MARIAPLFACGALLAWAASGTACARPKDPAPAVVASVSPVPPAATASASASASTSSVVVAAPEPPTPPASAIASAAIPPLPHVTVANIGMHVGGGPYDEPTKEPIKLSVAPHFDALKRCYAYADPKIKGDFGVDLLLQGAGGRAKVSHPRTQLRGEGFEACVIGVFEQIDFQPLKTSTTTVSYSLRFTP